MLKISFKYADELSNWEWRKQECVVHSIEECTQIYGLGDDCKYEIISVEEVTNMKEFIEFLRNGNGYQYICDKGFNLSKADLCNIIREFIYVVGHLSEQNIGNKDYLSYVAESIEENCLNGTEE